MSPNIMYSPIRAAAATLKGDAPQRGPDSAKEI